MGTVMKIAERKDEQYTEVFKCKKVQDNHFNQEQSTGVDSWEKLSFAHHPCTEKQGIRIYRSINTEVTTVDSAPG
jgi:hypothetical protein